VQNFINARLPRHVFGSGDDVTNVAVRVAGRFFTSPPITDDEARAMMTTEYLLPATVRDTTKTGLAKLQLHKYVKTGVSHWRSRLAEVALEAFLDHYHSLAKVGKRQLHGHKTFVTMKYDEMWDMMSKEFWFKTTDGRRSMQHAAYETFEDISPDGGILYVKGTTEQPGGYLKCRLDQLGLVLYLVRTGDSAFFFYCDRLLCVDVFCDVERGQPLPPTARKKPDHERCEGAHLYQPLTSQPATAATALLPTFPCLLLPLLHDASPAARGASQGHAAP